MDVHYCCEVTESEVNHKVVVAPVKHKETRLSLLARRCFRSVGWLIPGVVLTLLPKCPICLAAYIALGTGVGLSLSTAMYLRMLLLILCVASLAYFAARQARRFSALRFALTTKSIRRGGPIGCPYFEE